MEISCIYVFQGNEADVSKIKKFFAVVFPAGILNKDANNSYVPPPKKKKIDENQQCTVKTAMWLEIGDRSLAFTERNIIANDLMLNDLIMDFAQTLIQQQFNHIQLAGLQSTLLQQSSKNSLFPENKPVLQIVHCRNRLHWITVSTIHIDGASIAGANDVVIYDSLYSSVDEETMVVLKRLFGCNMNVKMPVIQKQLGATDCGLFAIATAVALVNLVDPTLKVFNQSSMRHHLIKCFERKCFSMFP